MAAHQLACPGESAPSAAAPQAAPVTPEERVSALQKNHFPGGVIAIYCDFRFKEKRKDVEKKGEETNLLQSSREGPRDGPHERREMRRREAFAK